MKKMNAEEIESVTGGFVQVGTSIGGWGAYGSVNWLDDILAAQARSRAVQEFLAANPWATHADVPSPAGIFH